MLLARTNPDFLVIGHRGSPNLVPENTMASFEVTIAVGGNAIETDVCVTSDGFFELKLPRETSAYVPRLLALAELVANPEALGVELPELTPEVPFIIVDTGSQMDLNVASQATGVDMDTLY